MIAVTLFSELPELKEDLNTFLILLFNRICASKSLCATIQPSLRLDSFKVFCCFHITPHKHKRAIPNKIGIATKDAVIKDLSLPNVSSYLLHQESNFCKGRQSPSGRFFDRLITVQ